MHLLPVIAFMGPFIAAYDQSDIFGRMIILGLIFLSILCWVLLIYKIWITRQVQGISYAFYQVYHKNKDAVLQLEIDNFPQPKIHQVPHPFGEIFIT